MTRLKNAQFLLVFSLYLYVCSVSGFYGISWNHDWVVTCQAFTPKGFRASIPDQPGLSSFYFVADVNVNSPLTTSFNIVTHVATLSELSKEVTEATNGRFVAEFKDVQLKVGDKIYYAYSATVYGIEYMSFKQCFTVTELEELSNLPITNRPVPPVIPWTTSSLSSNTGPCRPSATLIRGGTACSGQTILEDHFDKLREDIWQIEQYIPTEHPEYPFVSYQRSAVSIANGYLRIAPTLQQNMPGYNNDSIMSGNLNLFSGCTGFSNECSVSASGASILPPVVSGRITSKGLAFTYGTVHIRAKLPQGDWLYPEILLEPFRKKYGNMFASGVVNIARARGNKELSLETIAVGNNILYGGLIMDFKCRQHLMLGKKLPLTENWGDDFHVYTVNWTPEYITLSVDDQEWARIEPIWSGLKSWFPPTCRDLPRDFLSMGSKMAPFDDHFYITLGVAAGGITEFNDDLYSQNFKPKPWRNQARKALLHFWQDQDSWFPTWSNAELLVDYVKVVAL